MGWLIAGLHTGRDDGTGGHGVNKCKGVGHLVLQLGYEFLEHATNRGLCVRRFGLVALWQGGIGPLLFHNFFVKHNIEQLWNPPPPPPHIFYTGFLVVVPTIPASACVRVLSLLENVLHVFRVPYTPYFAC